MTVPRLRTDLEASSSEEAGLTFYDVVDPRSGTSMRLYEHEWLLARRMDGSASLDEIALWAGAELHFSPSPSDLDGYVKRLGELGFFDGPEPAATSPAAPSLPDETDFAGLDDVSASSTADVRSEVLLAVRSGRMLNEMGLTNGSIDASPPIDEFDEQTRPSFDAAPGEDTHATLRSLPALPALDETPSDDVLAEVKLAVDAAPAAHANARSEVPTEVAQVVAADVASRPSEPALRKASTGPIRPETPTKPQPEAPTSREEVAPRRSRGGLVALGTIGAIVVAGAAAYTFVLPSLRPVVVSVVPVGPAADRVEYYDGKGTVSRAAPQTLSFREAGRVVDVVGLSVETRPGMTLASLENYAALEKELADVRDRTTFYENALRVAQEKKKPGDVRKAQLKIDEKKKRQLVLEERVAKARIIATSVATVTEVLASAGTDVEADAPVLRVADKRTFIDAKLPPVEAKQLQRVGQLVQVLPVNGTAMGQAKVSSTDGETVKLEVTDDAGGAIANGGQVQLVVRRIPNVIRVPRAALTKSQGGGDQVFVLVGPEVKARLVTIAQTTAADVYLSAGLAAGDRVVINPTPELADGQKATTSE